MPSADPPMTPSGLATSSRDLPSASTARNAATTPPRIIAPAPRMYPQYREFGSLPVPIRWPYRCEPSEPKHWAMAKNTAMAFEKETSERKLGAPDEQAR